MGLDHRQLLGSTGGDGAMLAGICSRLARRLGWNVWAIRAVLLILLIANPLWTALGYAATVLLVGLVERGGKRFSADAVPDPGRGDELRSPELAARKQRIDDLEKRFRDWEQSLPKD